MLIFDQLKKDDPALRVLAMVVFGGMLLLFAGLWWVQVVSTRYYRQKLEIQSVRTVRMPAVRGSILDRNGQQLAQNRPSYSIDLYLEDLSKKFQATSASAVARARTNLTAQKAQARKNLGHRPTREEQKQLDRQFALTIKTRNDIERLTRYAVANKIMSDLGELLQQPTEISETNFQKHFDQSRALPLPVLRELKPAQIARFEEQSMLLPGMELDVQSLRTNPNKHVAAHLLGYVVRNTGYVDDEEVRFNYRLEDYSGVSGIEHLFDKDLRGKAGIKSVLVNNYGFRQGETIWSPAEPGQNVFLTIDLDIQRVAEKALRDAQPDVRGAVVVMDSRNGDVLAMASAPAYDPNFFAERHDAEEWAKQREYLDDQDRTPEKNRATHENYLPGSIFKIVVALAALEQGIDPNERYDSPGEYTLAGKRKPIADTAGRGLFDLNRAMAKSSNCYFIDRGQKPGVLRRIIELGQRLHLGERTLLLPTQETAGHFPSLRQISSGWYTGDTANLSIGQGKIDVTPLQMAVMVSAVANGGTVFWPRVVSRTEPQDGSEGQKYPEGRVRDHLGVSPQNLQLVRRAMLEDVISPEGTGKAAAGLEWRVAGKTGTAQVEKQGKIDRNWQQTWFVCFGPYENPRYVVVATVEGGSSGGGTCVPVVQKIYETIIQKEKKALQKTEPLAKAL